MSELDHYTTLFSDLIDETAMVVGVTHRDHAPEPGLYRYKQHLETFHKPWAVFPVDPRRKSDIVLLLDALVTMLEPAREFDGVLNRSCTEVFERTLENYLATCDVLELVIIATSDGQLRAQRQRGTVNTEQTALMGSSLMGLGNTLLRDLSLGACDTIVAESPQGFALVTSVANSFVLMSMTRSKNGLDSLLAGARQTAEDIAQSLPVGNVLPSGSP
jgi:predicted regulator of Ras-like GTPase activity (Roadblock/LC7/MglB family)